VQRREFITLFGGGAVAWPLAARGQPAQKMPKVGVLWHAGSAEEEAIYLSELQQGLTSLGYVDRKTIALENRFPNEQPERFVTLATELAALKVDVLVAVTQQAAKAAQRATTTIPIVFIVVPDPVGAKLVNSLARPGGNITGLTHIALELSGKRLAVFKEAFPRMTRMALLVDARIRSCFALTRSSNNVRRLPVSSSSGHPQDSNPYPLPGTKRTWPGRPPISPFDPNRTFAVVLKQMRSCRGHAIPAAAGNDRCARE
jgi:hypothetical protein